MRSVKNFTTVAILFALLILSHAATAQQSANTLLPGYWTLGINAGKAYQSSDVRSQSNGYGFGFTLGKNVYYQPGAPLSFDIRGRLLYARSFGLDAVRSYNIDKNSALNGSEDLNYLNYPEATGVTKGFVFQNHRTDLGELGLEAVLTLNKLKENTGIKVSLYGGAGLDYYNVKTDQADADGGEYFEEYAKLNDRAPTTQVLKNLKSAILDGNYETYADGFENGYGKIDFMPSLGAEVGFQVTPNFSIDFGHRLTFSGTDLLDGQQWSSDGNDLHHYTYAGLNFNINKQEKRMDPPVIRLIRPTEHTSTTRDPNLPVYATIENVNSGADVDFLVNGRPVSFNFNKEKFSSNVVLDAGQNEILISAQNLAGSDSKKLLVYLEDRVIVPPPPVVDNPVPVVYAPVVQITRPGIRNYTTENEKLSLEATVRNVDDKRDVEVWSNGRRVDFDFDSRRDLVRAELRLWEGENRIIVRAINAAGTAEDEVRVILENEIYLPEVQIERPDDRFETTHPTISVVAITQNVEQKRDLTLLVNGRALTYFDFNNGRVTAEVNLTEGYNTIAVEVRNLDGTDRDEVTVIYRKPAPQLHPPTVRITEPNDRLTVKTAVQKLRATITEVRDARDVTLTLNGRDLRNFTFRNGQLDVTLTLVEGNNVVRVGAVNADGRDEDFVNIRFEKAMPPLVSIIEPGNGTKARDIVIRFKANVKNVADSRDIRLTINGKEVRNFSFRNEILDGTLQLAEGKNRIVLKATNTDGSDEKSVDVYYIKPVPAPVVTITQPADGAKVTTEKVNLRATLKNVTNRADVTLTVNGRQSGSFDFNTKTGALSATVDLKTGRNELVVTGKNESGSAEDRVAVQLEIKFKTQTPQTPVVVNEKPEILNVNISQPTINPMDPQRARSILTATVKNVKSKNDLAFFVNEIAVTDFSFDENSGAFQAIFFVKQGKNTVRLRAANEAGFTEINEIVQLGEDPGSGDMKDKLKTEKVRTKASEPTVKGKN